MFGPGNWGNTGRFAWDAAMLKLDTAWLETDLWVGKYLQYKTDVWPNQPVDNFLMLVNYTQIKKLPFRLDLFYVFKYDSSGTAAGESGTGDLLSHTADFQAEGRALDMLDGAATFMAQLGRHESDTLRAFGANAKLGATAPVSWKPRLGVQYSWGSGDSNPTDGVHQTFDGVYGGRDIFFYGYLNLFFWANIRDLEFDFSMKPDSPSTSSITTSTSTRPRTPGTRPASMPTVVTQPAARGPRSATSLMPGSTCFCETTLISSPATVDSSPADS